MHAQGALPQARKDGLLEEVVGEEILLYDQESHIAHCLSPIAAAVWRHCDGEHNVAELAEFAGASESVIVDALQKLHEKDLLDAKPVLLQSPVPGESRREAIGRVARYGAAVAAGSLIVSATAATPAMAITGATTCELGSTGEFCCLCVDGTCEDIGLEKSCKEFCEDHKGFSRWRAPGKCA